jgi:hypothetical protein
MVTRLPDCLARYGCTPEAAPAAWRSVPPQSRSYPLRRAHDRFRKLIDATRPVSFRHESLQSRRRGGGKVQVNLAECGLLGEPVGDPGFQCSSLR